jgi:hypothetical protein
MAVWSMISDGIGVSAAVYWGRGFAGICDAGEAWLVVLCFSIVELLMVCGSHECSSHADIAL